jgi:tRNA A37 threonylcarbamoyladenosine biosynthesis protein TsaE
MQNRAKADTNSQPTKEDMEYRDMLATYSLVRIGKEVLIAFWRDELDPGGDIHPVMQFMSVAAFKIFHGNKSAIVTNSKGESSLIPMTSMFLDEAKRYDGVVYAPGQSNVVGNDLNMWKGFAVKPVQGNWTLMRRHIEEVLAGGKGDQARYIIRWTAWAIQNPGKQAEVALVLQGRKGTGKGTFGQALCRIFGSHGLQISSPDHLLGKHNKHLQHCTFLHSDEAYWAKDVKGESQIKRLITEPTILIEPKGIDAFPVRNCLHVLITGNSEHLVPATDDERRFAVMDMSDCRRGDVGYFKALNEEINSGGLGAMLFDMLHMELGGWHPRDDIPQSEGLQKQKLNTITGVDALIEFLCHEGQLPCQSLRYANRAALNSDPYEGGLLRWGQRQNISGLRYARPTRFADALVNEWGCQNCKVGRGNGLEFPPLEELRQRFVAKYKLTSPKWRRGDLTEWQKSESDPDERRDAGG